MEEKKDPFVSSFIGSSPWGFDQKKQEPTISEPARERSIEDAEEKLSRLEAMLKEIGAGWQVSIYRLQPSWCKGFLETIDMSDDEEPIDLDYIVKQWGGEKIKVRIKDPRKVYRGSVDIPLHSYPPRLYGEELVHPNKRAADSPSSALGNLEMILGVVEKLKKSDLDPVVKILLQQQAAFQTQPQSGVQNLLESLAVLEKFKGFFGHVEEKPRAAEGDLLGNINAILDTYSKIKGTNEPKKKTIVPALRAVNPAPAALGNPMGDPLSMSKLQPKSFIKNFLDAMALMPKEKRESILQMFMSGDIGEEDEKTGEEKEDLEDEGEEYSDDFEDDEDEEQFDDDEGEEQNKNDAAS